MKHFIAIDRSQLASVNRNLRTQTSTSADNDLDGVRGSLSCEMELAETPEVRRDVVARGKSLIADPNYPTRKQLRAIGQLLASRL